MLNKLTSRQKYILVAAHNESIDVQTLAARLQVSKRTIQRDLTIVQRNLAEFDVTLDCLPSGILSLGGDTAGILKAITAVGRLPSVYVLNPREREFYLISELLWATGSIKMAYLAHRLHVSEASIGHDLDGISTILSAKGLSLVRKRGYGVELVGSENAKREMLAEIFHQYVPINHLLRVWTSNDDEDTQNEYLRFIRHWFPEERIYEVRRTLLEELMVMELPLHEEAFYNFMIHVLLTLERLGQGQSLVQTPEHTMEDSEEFRIIKRVLHRVVPGGDVPIAELDYLANHLRGTKVQMSKEDWGRTLNVTMMELAYRFAKVAEQLDRHNYVDDQHLIAGLACHLEPAIHRMQNGMSIRNPLLPELQRQYPELFETVREASRNVLREFNLSMPDTEIGYLTMHFGAARERQRARRKIPVHIVCPNGISSAELLASRVRAEFPQIKIVSIGAITNIQCKSTDFVISTVDLGVRDRTVTVSPFLNDEDIRKIQRLLDLDSTVSYEEPISIDHKRETIEVSDLGRRFAAQIRVYHVSPMNEMDAVIETIAQNVVAQEFSDDALEIAAAIRHREKLGSITIPGKSLALLHARSDSMKRSYVGIFRVTIPLDLPSVGRSVEKIRAIMVLLAPMNEKPNMIENLGKLSAATIMHPGFAQAIATAPVEELRKLIADIVTSDDFNDRSDS